MKQSHDWTEVKAEVSGALDGRGWAGMREWGAGCLGIQRSAVVEVEAGSLKV